MATDYLLKTPHGWYFRRVIPKTLRTLLGKSQIKKPLHTRNLSEARIESRRLAFESDTLFKTLQGDHMGKPLNLIGSNLCLSGVKVKTDGSIEFDKIDVDPNNLESEQKILESTLTTLRKFTTVPKTNKITISEAIKLYSQEKITSGSWSKKTEEEIISALTTVQEILGDQDIDSITREDAITVRTTLSKLPTNRNKQPLYRNKSIAQILKMSPPASVLSTSSVNKTLTRASALWDWSHQQQYTPTNPFNKTQLKTGKSTRDLRSRYTKDELSLLFKHPSYEKLPEHKYWIPLIGAFSGMRLNEICQLDTNDVKFEAGTAYFDINDDDNNKKLKTTSSRRKIPVHNRLIELGFLNYLTKQQKSTKLFPQLELTRDGYSQTISKWFGRYREKVGIAKDGPDFHSLRHTFADELKQTGIDMRIIEDILGHVGHSQTQRRYTNQYIIEIMSPALNKLDLNI